MVIMNCERCGIEIERKNNRQKYCKRCSKEKRKEWMKEYLEKTEEKRILKGREYYKKNKERIREYNKEYKKKYRSRPKVKERIKEYNKEYSQKNKGRIKERIKEWYEKYYQRPKVKERMKEYNSRPKVKEKKNDIRRKRRKIDLNYRIKTNLRSLLTTAFKNYSKNGKQYTSKKYGINFTKIIEHMKPFPKDIENYHIDHIIPLSWFDFNNSKEIKWAFAPENHQWLKAEENIIKGNRKIYISQKEKRGWPLKTN